MESRLNRLYKPIIFSVCLVFILALGIYTLNGSAMRLSGDDYCYNAVVTQYGFWQAQVQSYTNLSLYNGNRYALTFISHLVDLIGPPANGFLPGLAIVIWLLSLSLLLRWLGATILGTTYLVAFFGAGFWILMTLAILPNLPQSLYWRSGMLTYLAPLVVMIILATLVTWQAKQEHLSRWVLFAALCIAILSGGFSEVGAALQTTVLGLAFLLSVLLLKKHHGSAKTRVANLFWVLSATLLGSGIAMVLLSASPYIKVANQYLPERASLVTLLSMVGFNSYFFIIANLYVHPLPILVIVITAGLFSFHWFTTNPDFHLTSRCLAIWTIITPIAGLLIISACMAPYAYIQHSYPEQRALVMPGFVLVGLLLVSGGLVGAWIHYLLKSWSLGSKWFALGSLFLFSLLSLYPLLPASQESSQFHRYQRWAHFWDTRHTAIMDARAQGQLDLEVIQLDHIIPDVAELSPDPDYWYNNCAEIMYGVDSIAANQPGWDK